MSDHWEMFECMMGEHLAFITLDYGIHRELDSLPPDSARFVVAMIDADARGLPIDGEFARLNEVQALLEERLGATGQYVGRVTTQGQRYFLFYTSLDEARCLEVARAAGDLHGHCVQLLHEPDPHRSRYWDELFPTDDDWQVIKDMKVASALREAGDTMTKPRRIEHWAYFADDAARSRFVEAVRDGFDSIELLDADLDGGGYGVRLAHVSLPDHVSMNPSTLGLARAAREHGGDYDGWESPVCKESDK
jgi:hypothetical protein